MTKKEHTTITELFQVLDLLESLDMQFWLDGGWGVDVLYGQQTRLHRDIDIDFDANYTDQLLDLLQERGYQIETNWLPTRVELYSKELGYRWVLSIPFFISCIRQQNPLTVLSKIILRKVKQFNLPPPKK